MDASSTPATTYTCSTASTSTFGNRLASVTYPGGDQIDYNYTVSGTASLDSVISRLDSMSESGTTLESYSYMGLGTVVEMDQPQDGVNLSYIGSGTGDAGDKYVGLDRFGRIVNQDWTTGTGGTGTLVDENKRGQTPFLALRWSGRPLRLAPAEREADPAGRFLPACTPHPHGLANWPIPAQRD